MIHIMPDDLRGERPALAVDRLVKRYGRRTVLREVTFDVRPGLLAGIQGENGAGKSTLLKCIVGLLRPTSGEVRVDGRLGYCPQEPALLDQLTVREHLLLLGAGYRLPRERIDERSAQLLAVLDATRYADTRIDRLSGGTRQKVSLVGALLHSPDVLVLDEPYQGFDHRTYLAFWEYAEQYRRSGGTVVVVSHLHSEISRFDLMLDLVDGRVASNGPATSNGPRG